MKVGTLEIELLANMARLHKEMNDAKRMVGGAMGAIERSVEAAKTALGSLAAGFTAIAIVRKLVEVQRQFDVLNASLITATGSTAGAAQAFAALEDFAATTPFGLAEVTESFIKMRNLGLDPSEAALRSYGNTASAMGKSLNQFIEAVADASTGEFERLKEFGIKARQQGDQVSLTFQGVTTRIGNNAREIQAYLRAIGENEFAGAMAQRAQTLDGALSNLGDTWDALFRQISSQQAGSLIYESVVLATNALQDLIVILDAMSGEMDAGTKKAGEFSVIQEGIAIVFETIAALGVNVAYVLKGIGSELGGLAAQAAAVATGDFARAAQIGKMMREDAARARAQVDADTERILNARKKAQEALAEKGPQGDRLAQFGTAGAGATGPSQEELKAAQRAAEASDKYIQSLRNEREEIGLTADQLYMIKAAREAAKAPTEAQRQAIMAEALALMENRKAWEEQQKVEQRAAESAQQYADLIERLRGERDSIHEQVTAQQDYNDRLGLTREELAALEAAKLEDAAASKEQAAALADTFDWSGQLGESYRQQAEELRKLAKLKREGADKETEVEEQKRALDEAEERLKHFRERVQDTLGDGLYDMLNGNFRSIGDAFKQMILKMMADAAAARLTELMFPGGGGGFGGFLTNIVGGFLGSGFGAGSAGAASASATADAWTASVGGGLGLKMPSFDGGGYTGSGPRAGGLDGKGGFLALMHPQETVNDHTRGQGQTGGGRSVSLAIQQTNHIDSRADRAQIMQDMARIKEATRAEIMDELRREGVV